jgi:uncharacterized damage-inducible protein DinB
MKNQIIETWQINNRVNLMLLDAISDEGFGCTLSKRGGRNVALQFVHLHYVRLLHLEHGDKKLFAGQTKIDTAGKVDRKLLKKRLTESAEAITEWLKQGIANDGKLKGFKRGVVPFLGYIINHEGHHRGSIILTLKQCGHPVPKDSRYGIWAWNQI